MFTTHFQQYRYIIRISLVLEWFYNSNGFFFPQKNYSKVYRGTSSCIISFPYCVPSSHQTREAVEERETQGRSFLTALIVSWGRVSVMTNALAQIAGDGVTIKMTFFGTGDWTFSCVCAHVFSAKEGRQQRSTVRHQWRDSKGLPPKPKLNKKGNFLLLVLQLLASIFPSGCSALLALKVTKGLILTRFTTPLALSST